MGIAVKWRRKMHVRTLCHNTCENCENVQNSAWTCNVMIVWTVGRCWAKGACEVKHTILLPEKNEPHHTYRCVKVHKHIRNGTCQHSHKYHKTTATTIAHRNRRRWLRLHSYQYLFNLRTFFAFIRSTVAVSRCQPTEWSHRSPVA